jgi:formate dehydrogenase subunit beta
MMHTILPVENGNTLAAVRSFLHSLLDSGTVEAVFVPMEIGDKSGAVVPALVTNPDLLENANPLAPVMPINNARAVSALTVKQPAGTLAAVLRPCEIRALIELVKLQQASLDGVILIGMDCPGTYEVTDYIELQGSGGFDLNQYLSGGLNGHEATNGVPPLRPACRMCDQPVPEATDISLHLFSVTDAGGIPITISEAVASRLDFLPPPQDETPGRQAVVQELIESRRQVRTRELAAVNERLNSDGGLASYFATCIRCHNCMTVCPICYCKTCLFKTASFDHPPEHYYNLARRKGGIRMLGDTMLFHLTRLNHMSLSCVSCGMCTSACPSDIPVGAIFSAIGAKVQEAFDYKPGRDVAEALPLITFQPDEWTEVGEKV